MKKIIKMYLHSRKEGNLDMVDEIGITNKEAVSNFSYALYEVEFDVEVDTETSETKILKVNGQELK